MKPLDGLYIGLMSGTSLDAIDAVLLHCSSDRISLRGTHSHAMPSELREEILQLCQNGASEIDRAGLVHLELGEQFAEASLALLNKTGTPASAVIAIGCHGQTIRHRPGKHGFSVQIGSADTLAVRTGIAVVSDFRNRDMVLGGQGAPLVPAFHRAMWGSMAGTAVVNIGGMANITWMENGDVTSGFDTGPGNVLMDSWVRKHRGDQFDQDGHWAASGLLQPALLARMQQEPYFAMPPPKSTGRELFCMEWLNGHLNGESPVNVQATLLELTAWSIAEALKPLTPERVLVCGGGAHNKMLMRRIQTLCNHAPVIPTDDVGLSADWVEGAAFAWLAWARLNQVPGNVRKVTGARSEAVLGALYLP